MKKILFIVLLIFVGCKSKPIAIEKKVNVLFIGNSLTYYHNMPKTLQAMLDEKHSNYNIEQSTFPGMSLRSHLEDIVTKSDNDKITVREKTIDELTETEKKLIEKEWDIIILQEGTNNLYFQDVVKEVIEPTIVKMKQLVKNKNCKYILFNTWPSKGKYPREKECIPKHFFDWKKYYVNEEISNKEKFCSQEMSSLEENIEILNKSFDVIKEKNNLTISNHPNLHYLVRIKFPELELYDDEYHPSEIGSFLNALEFYSILTNEKVSKIKYNGELDLKTVKKLKSVF